MRRSRSSPTSAPRSDADLAPDLVVVATPTSTHPALVREALDRTTARVLSEKPLASSHAEIRALEVDRPGAAERVAVAHHFAFSPEVTWARDLVTGHPDWGTPTRVLSIFNDPYGGRLADRQASLVSSWVDSGPNQLSLLAAFCSGFRVVGHDDEGHRAATGLEYDGGQASLVSNWLAADSSKQTVLEFLDGRVQVRMDHTSMTGLVVEDGRVTVHAGYTGGLGRKEAHYSGVYDTLLADPADVRLGVRLAGDIARLLDDATAAPPGGAWAGDVSRAHMPGSDGSSLSARLGSVPSLEANSSTS